MFSLLPTNHNLPSMICNEAQVKCDTDFASFTSDAVILGDGLLKLADQFDVDLSDLTHLPNSLRK